MVLTNFLVNLIFLCFFYFFFSAFCLLPFIRIIVTIASSLLQLIFHGFAFSPVFFFFGIYSFIYIFLYLFIIYLFIIYLCFPTIPLKIIIHSNLNHITIVNEISPKYIYTYTIDPYQIGSPLNVAKRPNDDARARIRGKFGRIDNIFSLSTYVYTSEGYLLAGNDRTDAKNVGRTTKGSGRLGRSTRTCPGTCFTDQADSQDYCF